MPHHVIEALVAPAGAPEELGQHWIDTAASRTWLAKGLAGVGDWEEVTSTATAVLSVALSGLNVALSGNVAATDTVLEAFGRLENRTAINDAKLDGADRVLKAGDTMTGSLVLALVTPDTVALTISGMSVTGSGAAICVDISCTWNTTGIPTALKCYPIFTAASSSALIFDYGLVTAGVPASVLNLRRDGRLSLVGRLSASSPSGSLGHGLNVSDANASTSIIAAVISHTLAAGPPSSNGFGVFFDVNLDSSTTANTRAARWNTAWSDATHATRTATTTFLSLANGSEVTNMIIGGSQVGFNAGSALIPGIANRSNLDMGLYFVSSLIGFAVEGVAQAWLGVNGFTMSAMSAPGSDPSPDAVSQWSAAGEWQYRTSAANEGAGLTHRVHNRAAVVDCSGTDYTFTAVTTTVTFGTVSPTITLPTAGTYYIFACAGVLSDAAGANDAMAIILYNSTDATSVGLGGSKVMTTGAGLISESTVIFAIYTVTASKTIVLRAVNSTAARGTLFAGRTNIGYIRLY